MKKLNIWQKITVLCICISLVCIGFILAKVTEIIVKNITSYDVILYYAWYDVGGDLVSENFTNVQGNFIDSKGNIYAYKIPRRSNPYERIFPIDEIDSQILNKYRLKKIGIIPEHEIAQILNYLNKLPVEYNSFDGPYLEHRREFFTYSILGNKKQLLKSQYKEIANGQWHELENILIEKGFYNVAL